MKRTYYFAYGSNLYSQQIKHRCPDSLYIKNVKLDGWQFRISPRHGGANIIKTNNPNDHVWGALYTLTDNDLVSLDTYEGIENGEYVHNYIKLDGIEGEILTYTVPECTGHDKAYKDYHERILKGMKQRSICPHYIEKFELEAPKQENHPKRQYTEKHHGTKKGPET